MLSTERSRLAQLSLVGETRVVRYFVPDLSAPLKLVLFQQSVSAGFPSPAEEFIEGKLDLNCYVARNPASTFYVRVSGDSMLDAGIHCGDLLSVDCSLEPTPGRVVIAALNGELTVKRLSLKDGRLWLEAENINYAPIEVTEPHELCIWGVVTNVIHPL